MSGGESPRLGEGGGTLKAAPRQPEKPKKMNINVNEKQSRTQRQMIREHLESGKSLTPLQALNGMRCFRLSARISELRSEGMDIKDRWYTAWDKKKVKEYYMDVVKEIAE